MGSGTLYLVPYILHILCQRPPVCVIVGVAFWNLTTRKKCQLFLLLVVPPHHCGHTDPQALGTKEPTQQDAEAPTCQRVLHGRRQNPRVPWVCVGLCPHRVVGCPPTAAPSSTPAVGVHRNSPKIQDLAPESLANPCAVKSVDTLSQTPVSIQDPWIYFQYSA